MCFKAIADSIDADGVIDRDLDLKWASVCVFIDSKFQTKKMANGHKLPITLPLRVLFLRTVFY